MPKFNELCVELQINQSEPTISDINKLKAWFEKNISSDQVIVGSIPQQFETYKKLGEFFLKRILPNINRADLLQPVPTFKNMTTIELMVELGVDVYLKALKPASEEVNHLFNGTTLLHQAATLGYYRTTQALLTLGADPKKTNKLGESALFSALKLPITHEKHLVNQKQKIFVLLYSRIPEELTATNQEGCSLVHLMAAFGFDTLLQRVLNKHPELAFQANKLTHYPIHQAILNNQYETAKTLLQLDNAFALKDQKNRTALHYAAIHGQKQIVKVCCEVTPNLEVEDALQKTALILAVIAGNLEAIEVLLSCGADPMHVDASGRTALHYAVENQHLAIIERLLDTAININAGCHEGYTALDLVQDENHNNKKISDLLRKNGALHGPKCAISNS